jgi:hypothetical protein
MKFKGQYVFEWEDGRKEVFDNVIVQNFFDGLFDALNGSACNLQITHMATGDGTSSALKADTALENEIFRKAISSKSFTSTKAIFKLSLAASESAFNIKEIGVFAEATDTPESGILISRCNVNIDKNASTQLLITYTITAE